MKGSCAQLVALSVFLLTAVVARPSGAQNPLDTMFPWYRWNGVRVYGLGSTGNLDVDPDLIIFDDTTSTATVTIINPLATPQPLWIAPECGGDGHLQPDDPLAGAWHTSYRCAVPWISGYPQYLVLAPHERRTLTLHLHPPSTLPDGRYRARLMLNGIDGHGMGHDETAVEYVKGPAEPRPTRTRWTAPALASVKVKPAVLVLDDTTQTATVTLTNPGTTATELWLTMDCPWFRLHYETVSGDTHKSQYEFTWHLEEPNIVTWLNGYPQHLILAPHERRTVILQLHPFRNGTQYPAGSYYAQLRYVQTPVLTVVEHGDHQDTTFTTPEGAVDIVYHEGVAAQRRLTLGPVQYTRHSDGTATACVIVQQPGLGVVVVLHAALQWNDHRRRHDVAAWQMDTTAVVWTIVHDRLLQRPDIGKPVIPDPICVALPKVAPGRYQLAMSVRPLGGDIKHVATPVVVP